MASYPIDHRKALGEYVRRMRSERGYADLSDWMSATKRSDRYLLGLERGEPAGPKTIKAVAEALGIEEGVLFRILNTGDAPTPTAWGEVGNLEDHAADPAEMMDLNLMFSQAVRFAATIGALVPEVREEAERVSLALSRLFSRGYQLWDRQSPLDREDDPWGDDIQFEGGGEGEQAPANQMPAPGPADQPGTNLNDEDDDEGPHEDHGSPGRPEVG